MMTCAVCGEDNKGSRPLAVFTQKSRKEAGWYECLHCRSLFTTAYSSVADETIHSRNASYGQKEAGIKIGESKKVLYERILHIILQEQKEGAYILDHGASFGGFSLLANQKGFRVTALDILPEAITYLKEHGVEGEMADSVQNTQQILKKQFDAAVAIDCCYYWKDVFSELRSIRELLKPGGTLVLRISDKKWLFRLGIWLQNEKLLQKSVHDHLSIIRVGVLTGFLKKDGFQITAVSSVLSVPSSEISLMAKAQYYLGELFYKAFRISFSAGFLIVCRKI